MKWQTVDEDEIESEKLRGKKRKAERDYEKVIEKEKGE